MIYIEKHKRTSTTIYTDYKKHSLLCTFDYKRALDIKHIIIGLILRVVWLIYHKIAITSVLYISLPCWHSEILTWLFFTKQAICFSSSLLINSQNVAHTLNWSLCLRNLGGRFLASILKVRTIEKIMYFITDSTRQTKCAGYVGCFIVKTCRCNR